MNYDEAYNYIFNDISQDDGLQLLLLSADNRIKEGIDLIKKITQCDDNIAKIIWCDVREKYGEDTEKQLNESKLQYKQVQSNQPKCPTCGSTNLSKVSNISKAGSVFMFGLLSQKVKKTWHCNNCKYEW